MRIAIPIWDDKVSPVLDTASRLLIVDIEEQRVSSRFEIYLDEQDFARRSLRIQGMEVDMLICGAVSHPFARMLAASGIDVIAEISGQAEEVLTAYLEGNLFNPKFLMPGCKCKRFVKNDWNLFSKPSCSQPGKESGCLQGEEKNNGKQ